MTRCREISAKTIADKSWRGRSCEPRGWRPELYDECDSLAGEGTGDREQGRAQATGPSDVTPALRAASSPSSGQSSGPASGPSVEVATNGPKGGETVVGWAAIGEKFDWEANKANQVF